MCSYLCLSAELVRGWDFGPAGCSGAGVVLRVQQRPRLVQTSRVSALVLTESALFCLILDEHYYAGVAVNRGPIIQP